MGLRLYLHDIGIEAGTVAVLRPHAVVVKGVLRQSGNVLILYIADAQIVVAGHIIDKRRVRSDIQQVTCRAVHRLPVRREAGASHISGF